MKAEGPSTGDGAVTLDPKQQEYAVRTWHYLRLAMIGLVGVLAAAVAYEVVHQHGCVQTSISAYYYTHAQAVFVAALIAIGTCLICLRGSTEWEDVLLNLAGMLAAVVALVPTPDVGDCDTLRGLPGAAKLNIENNVTALLAVGGVVLVVLTARSWRRNRHAATRIGYGLAFGVWLVALAVFLAARTWFVDHAHIWAAGAMFACIIAVAVVNAFSFKQKQRDPDARNRYSATAWAMATVVPVWFLVGKYHLLAAEIDAIGTFAVFWALQTEELRHEGVRPAEPGRRPPSAPTGTPAP